MDEQLHPGAGKVENSLLAAYSHSLGNELEALMSPGKEAHGSRGHAAGYVEEEGKSHPKSLFVRSAASIHSHTGEE